MAVAGLGLDVCSVERVRRILQGSNGRRFLERVYSPAERSACEGRADPSAAFAARFAAKEALIKALGAPPGLRFREMEVLREAGPPVFRLSGQARAEVERRRVHVLLSLTHDAGIAAAAVILDQR